MGRTKKLRLAVSLAGMLAGKKLASNRELLAQGAELIENTPQLKELQGQLTGRLVDVAKEAAIEAGVVIPAPGARRDEVAPREPMASLPATSGR